jgi:hypothetical protein
MPLAREDSRRSDSAFLEYADVGGGRREPGRCPQRACFPATHHGGDREDAGMIPSPDLQGYGHLPRGHVFQQAG